MTPALGLLLIATGGVAIHLEERGEVPLATASLILAELGRQIEAETGAAPVIDDLDWGQCTRRGASCLLAIRSRTRAEDLILVRLLGGAFSIRFIAQTLGATSTGESVEADLPLDANGWAAPLRDVSRALYPGGLRPKPAGATSFPAPPRASGPSIASWVLLGAGAVAAGVGVAFGVSAKSAQDSLLIEPHLHDDFVELSDRMRGRAITANILFGAAAVSAIAGLVLAIDD